MIEADARETTRNSSASHGAYKYSCRRRFRSFSSPCASTALQRKTSGEAMRNEETKTEKKQRMKGESIKTTTPKHDSDSK